MTRAALNMNPSNQNSSKSRWTKIALAAFLFFSSSLGRAEVIFEGYYKVYLSNEHSGYAIQRYEFDAAKKEFTSTYYIYVRTSPDGKKFISESLAAKSDDKFHPKNYQYTAILEGKPMTVDAKFSGNMMTAKIRKAENKGKPKTVKRKIPEGTFLSTMLLYLILQKGMSVGKNFSYNAVAEEDAEILPGTVKVTAEEKHRGMQAYKLEYSFKNVPSSAYISQNGHVLDTKAPQQNVATELVASASEARQSFPFPQKTLKALFGNVPTGQVNALTQQKSSGDKNKTPPKSQ